MTKPDDDDDVLPPSDAPQEEGLSSSLLDADTDEDESGDFPSEVAMRLHLLGKLIIPPPQP